MKIKIIAFGSVSDIVPEIELTFSNGCTTNELKQQLIERYPKLKQIQFTFAVNEKISRKEVNLGDGDEVALLAPFSGG